MKAKMLQMGSKIQSLRDKLRGRGHRLAGNKWRPAKKLCKPRRKSCKTIRKQSRKLRRLCRNFSTRASDAGRVQQGDTNTSCCVGTEAGISKQKNGSAQHARMVHAFHGRSGERKGTRNRRTVYGVSIRRSKPGTTASKTRRAARHTLGWKYGWCCKIWILTGSQCFHLKPT